jgi:outer membrane protein TolC
MTTAAIALLSAVAAAAQMPASEALSLRETLRAALSASPEVAAAQLRRDGAALEEPLLLSNLDPHAIASYSRVDDKHPRAAPTFEGTRAQVDRWEAGLRQTTLLGTEAQLVFRNEKLVNSTMFRPLNPTVDSRLALEVRQRFLRYFWGRPDVARRSRARLEASAAEALLMRTRSETLMRAARAYLELGYADGLVAIREAGVEDAKRLLAKYVERRRYGLAEESDLLQAMTSLELQETERLLARSMAQRARVTLGAVLNSSAPAGGYRAGKVDGLPERSVVEAGEEAALARRPEVVAARRQAEAMGWAARVTRLDTLPDLSLDASYSFAGLDTGYRGAWSDMSGWRHPVTTVGLSASVPLGFRQEKLTRRQAEMRRDAAWAEAAVAETAARREWRDAREGFDLASVRASAARRLVELERRKYAAGQEDFKRGRASTDLLLRFQQDIRRAEAELLRAETDEKIGLFELARAGGALADVP